MSRPGKPGSFRFPLQGYLKFVSRYARHAWAGQRPVALETKTHRPDPASWLDDRVTSAWLGHATVVVNFFGTWIITDPVLADRIGIRIGGIVMGPRRLTRPALRIRDLPPVDLILISHAHMDHLDLATLSRFPRNIRVITHRGVGDLLRRFQQVDEIGWGEQLRHGDLTIEGVGARHWGARTIHDQQRGFGGFLLEQSGKSVLYAGDTAYTDLYRSYAGRGIDLAILPIGAYDPWIANHASPEEAWQMGRDMKAEFIMPIHHSTFRLSREPMEEPLQRLLKAAGPEDWRIITREIGHTWAMERGGSEDPPASKSAATPP
jgi:L-ascorbate metabolism protein UlaG (beta-lactamase superfamily)